MRFFLLSCTDQRRLALFMGYSSLPTSITLVRLKSFDYVVFKFYIGRSWTETEKKEDDFKSFCQQRRRVSVFFRFKRHFLVKLSAE